MYLKRAFEKEILQTSGTFPVLLVTYYYRDNEQREIDLLIV